MIKKIICLLLMFSVMITGFSVCASDQSVKSFQTVVAYRQFKSGIGGAYTREHYFLTREQADELADNLEQNTGLSIIGDLIGYVPYAGFISAYLAIDSYTKEMYSDKIDEAARAMAWNGKKVIEVMISTYTNKYKQTTLYVDYDYHNSYPIAPDVYDGYTLQKVKWRSSDSGDWS